MLTGGEVLLTAFLYLGLLFAIAYWGDKRAAAGRSVISNASVYALSMAIYCTSWTFFGSVGRAAKSGIDFMAIYLGPTLIFAMGWFVIGKMIRIAKTHHITSIADFIASRYGKSTQLGGVVTVIAIVGITPYISLQLKAVSSSFLVLLNDPTALPPAALIQVPVLDDTAFYAALLMAAFAILFGTRRVDATEHHEGMVLAIAFESVVKLAAFLACGIFVTHGLFNGFGDLFAQGAAVPRIAALFHADKLMPSSWIAIATVSMAAAICLPRQFHMAVVENVNEAHLRKAVWLFPLYLLLINLFVLPIAVGGLVRFGDSVKPDNLMLLLPMAAGYHGLALFVFLGGLSAATGMVIVESVALSTMVCNDLVIPVLLRLPGLRLSERADLTKLLLAIRRGSILAVLLLGYLYGRLIGETFALVTIGLMSFAAVAQFAPALIGGMYWRSGSRRGALAGLLAGSAVWAYTLLLPSVAPAGWLPEGFLDCGPWGIALLRPQALFGLTGYDPLAHSLFWSLLANIGAYIGVSLLDLQSPIERIQATLFVEILRQGGEGSTRFWRGTAVVSDLHSLAVRFIGAAHADQSFASYARSHKLDLEHPGAKADADLVKFTERLLAGAIGAASARVMVASVVKGEGMNIDAVMEILDEASHVIEYSRELTIKSRDLEAANEQLKELDRLKDEFLSTVTHELRTPLTSIRSFTEILSDNPDLPADQRQQFLAIVIKESERLTRLINEVLDLAKIESGKVQWHIRAIDMAELARDAANALSQLFREKNVALEVRIPTGLPPVRGDYDRLMQVVINLMSNAVKFCEPETGRVALVAEADLDWKLLRVSVIDNGPGIAPAHQAMIFDKFRQVGDTLTSKPAGTGLGLSISRRIVEHLGGRIWVESNLGHGATFSFRIPFHAEGEAEG